MIRLGNEREQLGVVFDQIGTPTYANDLARAILRLSIRELFPVFIISATREYAPGMIFTVAIHRMAGITSCKVSPLHTDEYPAKAPRPQYSVLDKTKIKKTFGIEIPHWEESLQVCIDRLAQ